MINFIKKLFGFPIKKLDPTVEHIKHVPESTVHYAVPEKLTAADRVIEKVRKATKTTKTEAANAAPVEQLLVNVEKSKTTRKKNS